MNKPPTKEKVLEFLRESNAIEGVYDEESLAQSFVAWEYLAAHERLTTGVILRTHKTLMLHQPGLRPDERGYWRKCGVRVGDYIAIPYEKVPEAVEGWVAMANVFTHDWKNMHVAFENIHPFVDGNGRVGRMLMNWQRLKFGVPLLVLKADERQKYYQWFKQARP